MMGKLLLISVFTLIISFKANAQIYLNPGVDTSFVEVKSALRFYNSYIADFKGMKLPDMSKYWPGTELKLRKVPDQIIYAQNDYPLYSQGYQLTILYIRPTDNYVHIKTQFSSIIGEKNIMTMAVTNHYIAFDKNKKPYFINPITINTTKWHIKILRNVTFIYPPKHVFDTKRADSLVNSITKLEKEWGLKKINIRYYLAQDQDELFVVRGLDFAVLMGNVKKPSGISDDKDNQVFCGGLGENYFHEVVHLYLNRLYPQSPIQEGLAVLYGGSMGHKVNWHIKRVNKYLLQHPEADLNDFEKFWYTDPYTNPGSAIQGMICEIIYKKDGIAGLKRLMNYSNYKVIFKNEFGVNEGQLNSFLRKKIAEQADE